MRQASLALWLTLIAGCTAPAPDGGGNGNPRGRDKTSASAHLWFRLDLDGDGALDSLMLHPASHPDGPGAYDTLKLSFANGRAHALAGRWDAPHHPQFNSRDNLVPSTVFFVMRSPRAGTLVFLFGEDVACCAQALSVYRVTAGGIAPYLARDEVTLIAQLEKGATRIIEADGLPEPVGGPTSDISSEVTYHPILVTALEETPRLDTAASVARTRLAFGGFAGLRARDDVHSIVRRDGTHYLWDTTRKRRLP